MTGDRRWPDVDRLLVRQPWAQVQLVLERNQLPEIPALLGRLRRYVEMLVQWNRSVSNLVSKRDEERIVEAHLLPSIEVCGWIKSRNLIRWCDLGSGGGLPAIPLILCGVGEKWDLVESRRTKTLFLMRCVAELGLGGVRVLPSRIEDLLKLLPGDVAPELADTDVDEVKSSETDEWAPAESDEIVHPLEPPYDGFTSRATMPLGPTLRYAARIVRPEGEAFLWKGSRMSEESEASPEWQKSWESGETKSLSIEHSVVANFKRRGPVV